ncbi:hypothetical protein BDZ97DRAFT_1759058 [Flammula alnicola]|nr:hypothetical protein BDZ97DRAFT_1759058 [Flammula alnicola]
MYSGTEYWNTTTNSYNNYNPGSLADTAGNSFNFPEQTNQPTAQNTRTRIVAVQLMVTMGSKMHSMVGSASKEMLFASQNHAYMDLFQECMHLRAELDVKREIISLLKDRNTTPSQAPLSLPSLSVHPPESSHHTLTLPPSLLLYCEEDCKNEPYYDKPQWRKHIQSEWSKGNNPSRLKFLTDSEGIYISKTHQSVIYEEACMVWNSLHSARQDPTHWKTKTKFAKEFFSNSMRTKFEESCLCKDDWKVEAYTTIKYSDWTSRQRESGDMPSINMKRKVELNDDDNDAQKLQPAKKPNTSNGAIKQCPRVAPYSPAATSSDQPPAPPSIISTPSDSSSAATTHPGALSDDTVQGLGLTEDAATVKENSHVLLLRSSRVRGRIQADMFSNMDIPKPPEEHLAPVLENLMPSTSTASEPSLPATKSSSKKAEKPMEPTKSVTPRNLFAIEYLATHKVTVAEFKVVWHTLDRETVKKYEALSREKKKEAAR